MKRIMSLAMLVLLSATACSSGNDTAPEAPPEVETTPEPSESAEAAEQSSDQETPVAEETDDSIEPNERGNLPVGEGIENELTAQDGTAVATMKLSELRADPTCTSEYTPDPEGQLYGFDIELEVESAASNHLPDGYWVSSDLFQILSEDGEVVESDPGSTSAAYACPSTDDQFPFGAIRPGTSASGLIVVESPVDSGYLVYSDYDSGTFYEWEF